MISLARSLEHVGGFERKFRDLCLEISVCKVKHRYELAGMFPESEPVPASLCPVALREHFCCGLVFSYLSQKGQHPYTYLNQWTTALGMLLATLPATPQRSTGLNL